MELNYRLKYVSIFIGAIAMLFGAGSLAQAETLASQSEKYASASSKTDYSTSRQTQTSVSNRAIDLLAGDDSDLAPSEFAPTPDTSTEYSFTSIPATEPSATNRTVVSTSTQETVFSDVYMDQPISQTSTQTEQGASNTETLHHTPSTGAEAFGSNATQLNTFRVETGSTIEADTDRFSQNAPLETNDMAQVEADSPVEDVAQVVTPGRATRSGQSYIGIGGNIGLGDGETALGEGSFAAFSKIGLTRNISVRPSVLINSNPTILLPVTFDFIPGVTEVTENVSEDIGFRISPFVGAGAAISTGDDVSVDFLATGGVDVPLGDNFTGVAAVNVSLFDDPAIGLLLGVGVNFPALR